MRVIVLDREGDGYGVDVDVDKLPDSIEAPVPLTRSGVLTAFVQPILLKGLSLPMRTFRRAEREMDGAMLYEEVVSSE